MPTDRKSYQSTDFENSKAPLPVSRPGDDLKVSQRGGIQEIAKESTSGTQHITGSGGDAVTATTTRNVKQ